MKDYVKSIRGILEYRIYENGKIIERYKENNLIVNGYKEILSKLLGENDTDKGITKIGFGTDGTAPASENTGLTDAYVKSISSVSYPEAGQVKFHWTLDILEANGKDIQELGLLCDDNTLLARKSRAVIEKNVNISLEGSWTIIF